MTFHDPSGVDTLYKEIELKIYSINPVESKDWLTKEVTSSDEIIVIHEDSEALLKKNVQELAKLCKEKFVPWVEYYKFVEQFADLKYNHAITIHKSQGSTYKQAIINIRNVNINRNTVEKERLLYTGVTRAAELLILYNV
jgi:ATP-dependent exoDNAse (exonuclease V) alpha subunit